MSILIDGMDMPTEGGTIIVYKIKGNYFAARAGKDELFPIVSIPPHGRLIDSDELFKEMERKGWFDNADRDKAEDLVLDAPTIIPSDEE